ncbi:MAG TPA: inositol 2-dehydrogenase [Achromobacter sp.]|nr:inositol 2-dehydrogenase [Achromobacter sp.]
MKVALFGAGRIGATHAANLAAMPGLTLATVCDPATDLADALADRHGARRASEQDALSDPDIQAVLICSSTDTHSDLIMRAAQAGKHIFCEKPVDLSTERAVLCQAAVAAANVRCMIGFQRRFDPTFSSARNRLARGAIGAPEMLVITSRDPSAPSQSYVRQSGGIFRDMLIHDFDVFRWLLGEEATMVHAAGSCLTDPRIAEAGDIDSAAVTLRTASGKLCQINASRRAAYGYDQRFEILGSDGLLACGNHRPSEVAHWTAAGLNHDLPEPFFLQRYREAYRLELDHFFTQLRTGGPLSTTIADGIAAQRLADAAAQSLSTGQPVAL